MKKSKVLAISLSAVALTSVAIATPLITTSCSSTDNFVDYALPEDFMTLKPDATGYKLEREKGTNNFTLHTPNAQWTQDDLKQIKIKQNPNEQEGLFTFVSKEKLKELGFDNNALNSPKLLDESTGRQILSIEGVRDKNGQIVYPGYDMINKNDLPEPDPTKASTLIDTFKVFQFNQKTFIEELKKQGLPEDIKEPTPEQIAKYKDAFYNSIEKNYNFRFKFTIIPKSK